ncbi:VWA domain-containing protein [Paraneptunicella aestuarii]|uniref:vWA domain-containing protein n=1 Tax=Paraneptunicella aestuarii TaxID=2831148 RepID=UPI001E36A0BE|nr:VWA domain-containing protein [Paraneptunicella aestuarii]UAA40105.1 VWA domain-containing protein [Paraneptunicella aestuarii]
MFEFAWLWAFAALPLPILFRLIPEKKQGQFAALKVPKLTSGIAVSTGKTGTSKWRLLIATLAWIALVTAAARPQWLGEPVSIPAEGRDLMLAVDLSGSMKMEDMEVNGQQVDRLVMIKHVMKDFIQRRVGDRLGLILFADTAYLQTPLTYDRDTVEQFLNEAVIELVGEQTAIGDAIGLAVKRFQQKEDSNRVLILLTDGQNTAGNITPEQAKELAISEKITVYTIGVGADQMLMRSLFGTRRINPSQELDEDMLQGIAQSTGGKYFRARDTESLQEIYATLDELEPVERDTRQMRPLQALFYYPLALALCLSLLLACTPFLTMISQKLKS